MAVEKHSKDIMRRSKMKVRSCDERDKCSTVRAEIATHNHKKELRGYCFGGGSGRGSGSHYTWWVIHTYACANYLEHPQWECVEGGAC